jgi:hypothetical protein
MRIAWGESIKWVGLVAAVAMCLSLAPTSRPSFASETDGGSVGGGGDQGGDGDQDQCHPACHQEKLTCKLTARTSHRSCAEDCRASLQPQACFDQCKSDFQSSRSSCVTTAQTCNDDCDEPGNQPSPCVNACLQDLQTCLAGLGGKQCWNDCVGSAQAASATCWTDPHPVMCLLGIAHDLSSCLEGCAADMQDGASACKDAAEQCKQACEAGSASRAFLDPRPSLID